MKTLKSKYIKGEKIKLKELNKKEQSEYGFKYVITFGDYDDIDHEEDNLSAAIEFYDDWGN